MSIKLLVMDVDGTLTDGKIYLGNDGEELKAFNVKDGYRIISLEKYGIISAIITGKKSKIVENRAKALRINEIHQGIMDKAAILKEITEKYNIGLSETAYIGDDENDLDCMALCGLSAAPSDAVDTVIKKVDFVCKNIGGNGAVREFIDYIIEQNRNVG